uniref:Cytochrome b561 domain-containing protein n=2 Tax=Clytia hemisphaerica TaxID=252671 RepID=A0A7M5XPD0_9CNID
SFLFSYERTIKPSQGNVYLHDLSNPLMMVVAFGKSGSGNRISRHGLGDYATTAAFDLLKASGEITTSGRMLQDKEVAHGILMVIAWIICSTIGIFMARYMKQATKEKKITGKPAWFPLHQGLMMSCVVVFFIAFIVILVEKQGWAESAGTHGILGLIAIILGLIQ